MERLDNARILIYSHDSFGLGHLRRCRAIAHAIVDRYKGVSVLILSGSPIIGSFDYLPRVDFVRIPGVIKLHNGEYQSLGLHIALDQTMAMRAAIIRQTAESFRPDLFLVDKEPLGLNGEVAPTLRTHPRPGSADPGAVTVAHTITAREAKGSDSDATSGIVLAHALTSEGADASEDGTGRGTPLVPVFAPLTAGGGGGRRKENDWNLSDAGAAVRRLTPRECERLQGFPDDWTAGQSDAARYRQLGNAIAVPVAAWLAARVAAAGGTERAS